MAVDSKEAYENCQMQFDEMLKWGLLKAIGEPYDQTRNDKQIANLQKQVAALLNYIRLERFENGEEKLVFTIAKPLYEKNKFLGVVGIDISMQYFEKKTD